MQLAVVNGDRVEATPGQVGQCPDCGRKAVAKCGPKVMHHWAHAGRNCDPWWENETQWHRDWKNLFPQECREISHTASEGEIHRADIKAPGGIYVEVQHSAMSQAERQSREAFYDNMIWIVDGLPFAKRFHLDHILPDPRLEWVQDLKWFPVTQPPRYGANGLYHRFSLIAKDKEEWPEGNMHELFSMHHRRQEFEEAYIGHHQYFWLRAHSTWLEATRSVYLDFGSHHLMRLERYPVGDLPCVRLVNKLELVSQLHAKSIANDLCI